MTTSLERPQIEQATHRESLFRREAKRYYPLCRSIGSVALAGAATNNSPENISPVNVPYAGAEALSVELFRRANELGEIDYASFEQFFSNKMTYALELIGTLHDNELPLMSQQAFTELRGTLVNGLHYSRANLDPNSLPHLLELERNEAFLQQYDQILSPVLAGEGKLNSVVTISALPEECLGNAKDAKTLNDSLGYNTSERWAMLMAWHRLPDGSIKQRNITLPGSSVALVRQVMQQNGYSGNYINGSTDTIMAPLCFSASEEQFSVHISKVVNDYARLLQAYHPDKINWHKQLEAINGTTEAVFKEQAEVQWYIQKCLEVTFGALQAETSQMLRDVANLKILQQGRLVKVLSNEDRVKVLASVASPHDLVARQAAWPIMNRIIDYMFAERMDNLINGKVLKTTSVSARTNNDLTTTDYGQTSHMLSAFQAGVSERRQRMGCGAGIGFGEQAYNQLQYASWLPIEGIQQAGNEEDSLLPESSTEIYPFIPGHCRKCGPKKEKVPCGPCGICGPKCDKEGYSRWLRSLGRAGRFIKYTHITK